MKLETHGLTRGRLSFGERFVPFDAIASLEGTTATLQHGGKVQVPRALTAPLAQVLAGPVAAADLADNARAFTAYLAGSWSPERACRALLAMAERMGATDVHLEALEPGWAVRLRLAGELLPFVSLGAAAGLRLVAALKHLSGCLPYRRDLVQEGRISRPGVAADARASFLPTPLGERVALRLFGRLLQLEQLGLPDALRGRLEEALAAPSGLLVVAGPSGGGKTTTLYSALAHVAAQRKSAHLSIEDPVEQRLRLAGVPVDQLELCPERGVTGAVALAAALRQDVDVLAVGEVRSAAEAQLALQAAHTGRLVLAGVHAGSCAEARLRLEELGCDPGVLRDSLRAVLHQRLRTVDCAAHAPSGCSRCAGVGRVRVVDAGLWRSGESWP